MFIMDVRTSLSLLSSVGDMEGFNQVYKLGFGSDDPLGLITPNQKELSIF